MSDQTVLQHICSTTKDPLGFTSPQLKTSSFFDTPRAPQYYYMSMPHDLSIAVFGERQLAPLS